MGKSDDIKELLASYRSKRPAIKKRLSEFRKVLHEDGRRIFEELSFCILTPQSKAFNCDKAIRELVEKDLLHAGSVAAMRKILRKWVRFHNNKASYIACAREKASCRMIKYIVCGRDAFKVREWLVENVKGLGYKEASHFLRNIGLGAKLAILDRHILKNMKRYRAITSIPASLSRKNYLALEEKLRAFCDKIDIPMEELDLLFWSQEAGAIFK